MPCQNTQAIQATVSTRNQLQGERLLQQSTGKKKQPETVGSRQCHLATTLDNMVREMCKTAGITGHNLVTQCIMISGIFITGTAPADSFRIFKLWLIQLISRCGGSEGRFEKVSLFHPNNILLYHHLTLVSYVIFAFY